MSTGLIGISRIALRYSDVENRTDAPLEIDTEVDSGAEDESNRSSPVV